MKKNNSTTSTISESAGPAVALPVSPSFRLRWFTAGELRCKGPDCGKPIPAGFYGKNKRTYYCCNNCQYRFNLSQRKPIKCTFCKRDFVKAGTAPTMPFCSAAHYYQWRIQQLDQKKAGRFTALLHEYIDEIAPRHYAPATLNVIRCNLAAMFEFVNRSGIRSLNSVTPKVISVFLADIARRRPKSVGKFSGHLRFFFDWMILEGRRTKPNPVVSSLHNARGSLRLPRPLTNTELSTMWRILDGQPNAALRLAAALGQEAGLRIGEVANLRMEDVDASRQEAFVRLPNKVNRERYVPFHNLVKRHLKEWLAIRGDRDFDFLLVGVSGRPMAKFTLRDHLNKLLKKAIPGWSFHRLRHVASSTLYRNGADGTTVMKTFGWRSPAVMENYTDVRPEQIRESYDRAFQTQNDHSAGSSTTRSMDEFFSNKDDAIDSPVMKGT